MAVKTSWKAYFLNLFLKLFLKRYFAQFAAETSFEKAAAFVLRVREQFKKYRFTLPSNCEINDIWLGNLLVKWVYPKNLSTNNIILYFHGGGYTVGSAESYTEFTFELSTATQTKVLLVDYRLVPENPLTSAIEDALIAYQWLCKEANLKNIIFAGDSAGGGLALAAVAKLKDMQMPLPSAIVALSPWTDLLLTGESLSKNRKSDPYLVMPQKLILFEGIDLAHPYISPLYADLKGFPPIYIQASNIEILLDDSRRLAEKAQQAGVNIRLDIFENMPHCWQLFAKYLPEGKDALQKIGEFVRTVQ